MGAYAFPTLACRMQFEQTLGMLSTRGQDWLSTESRVTERLSVAVLRVTAQDFQTQRAAPEAVPNLGYEAARRTREGSQWPRTTAIKHWRQHSRRSTSSTARDR